MKTDAVILAAGYSSRAEAFKMELPIGAKPVLNHVVDAFYPICEKIIVVGGFRIERIEELLTIYEDKVCLVFNDDYDKGMFSSVKRGINEVTGEQFFLTPGDYPLITTKVCQRLLEYSGEIVIPKYKERGGHPILLPARYKEEIQNEEETSNLKVYLEKKEKRYLEINDESILLDIDTKEDYERIHSYYLSSDFHTR